MMLKTAVNTIQSINHFFPTEQINKPRVSSLHTGESLPSALDVALELLTEKGETKWSNDVTLMTFQWGQFLDHDLIATPLLSGMI